MQDEKPDRPSPPQEERVERIEIVERNVTTDSAPRSAMPMWVWLLPLVLVVIALAWYILATGTPTSPVEIITLLGSATRAGGQVQPAALQAAADPS